MPYEKCAEDPQHYEHHDNIRGSMELARVEVSFIELEYGNLDNPIER